jgi:hypothetical protein
LYKKPEIRQNTGFFPGPAYCNLLQTIISKKVESMAVLDAVEIIGLGIAT